MSETEAGFELQPVDRKAGRATTVVAVLALAIAILAGAAAGLLYLKVTHVEHDLNAAVNDLADEQQKRESLQSDLSSLTTQLESIRTDLDDASAIVDNIDSFLRTNDLASTDQISTVTDGVLAVNSRLDDLVNCLNDNLDAISRRGDLQFCG